MAKKPNKQPRVIILSNALSTSNKEDLPDVREVADRYAYVLHLEGNRLVRLYEQLETFRGQSPDLLILNGGDGTIHSALTFVMNKKIFKKMPTIALLAGGMTNMNARDLHTGGKAAHVLEKILRCFSDNTCHAITEERALLKVEFSDGRPDEYGMFFGGAAAAPAIKYCTHRLYPLGITGVAARVLTLIIYLFSLTFWGRSRGSIAFSPKFEINFDERRHMEGRFNVLLATTLKKLLFGSRARHVRGQVTFFSLRHSVYGLMVAFFQSRRGTIGKPKSRAISLKYAEKVTIKGDQAFILDGEIHDPGEGGSITLSVTEPLKFISFPE